MTVYVDNMRAQFGRMVMCHMIADTDEELHAMASLIGVARRWHQKAGTPRSHYDICKSKRALAISHGAREITQREAATILRARAAAEIGGAGMSACQKCWSDQRARVLSRGPSRDRGDPLRCV